MPCHSWHITDISCMQPKMQHHGGAGYLQPTNHRRIGPHLWLGAAQSESHIPLGCSMFPQMVSRDRDRQDCTMRPLLGEPATYLLIRIDYAMAVSRTHLHVISRHVVELYVRIQLRKASMNFHDCRIVLQRTHHIVIASPRWMRVRGIIHSALLPACSRWVRRCLGVREQAQQLLPQNTVYQTICMQGIVGDVEATCFTADSLLQSAALVWCMSYCKAWTRAQRNRQV